MAKYLLAVDGSENSQRAALFLLSKVQGEKASAVTIIHVVNAQKEIYNFPPFTDYRDIEEAIRKQWKDLVDEQSKAFTMEHLTVNTVILKGDPGYEIAEYANKENFDQIILGTRGLSDFKGLVLGSVSHKVIHFAHCPVTLVK